MNAGPLRCGEDTTDHEDRDDQRRGDTTKVEAAVHEFLEILQDGINQEATVILEAGVGYNVVDPATATFKLKLKDF